ncbi:SpoIIE family protein phosphatase [Paracrocinitomix mangrovi]|uniref:two-component regulator propeller domain-containing protein n=1 Tax=Paracrocinitomix mangrovi TaxID=2862509 RepID=UPI001C8DD3D2|nr:two-component regulator propeller domain-containing protein [Paracrocinitomix mangrovi]UKN02470.1 SpoIIE family protein phosphatase [Paracrocinitomix mangrovi]
MHLKSKLLLYFTIVSLLVFTSCGKGASNQNDSLIEESELVSTVIKNDSLISIKPFLIDNDSIPPVKIVKANEPHYNKAHKNIVAVNEPILQVLSTSLPHFSIGQDGVLEPEVEKADGKMVKGGYNRPQAASQFDYKDAASYNIKGIDVDQGLNSSYIMDIIEDKRGNIWFATWTAGVTMYNGRSFIMFDENKGMVSNYIWSIFEDREGNIWFGSDGSGASVYNGHDFIKFNYNSPLNQRLVFDITEDKDGNIWMATNDGLTKFDGEYFYTYREEQGLGGNTVTNVIVSEKGDIWVTVDGAGVNRFDGEGFTHYTTNEGLISDNTTVIFEDDEENIWIGTSDAGLCRYDGYTFITYQEEMGLPNNFVKSITQDSQGNLWIGTEGGGACRFNRFDFKHFTKSEGMSNNSIWSILEDSDGNIWFGTFGAGANVYNESSFENYTEYQGLNNHLVRYIVQDRKDNLWFASNRGISKYDGDSFWHYTEEQGVPLNHVRNMLIDKNGDFWLGTGGNGVARFDGTNFYHYNSENGLCGDFILALFEDRTGNIWIGTAEGGVTKFDGEHFSHITEEQGLANNTVHSITQDTAGNMYFGTKIGGLDVYDGKNIRNISAKDGLVENSVISLHVAHDGSIWAGSEGYGINHIIGDTIYQYVMEGGNSHNIIWSIVEDNNNNLWLGTERGLNKLSFDDENHVSITNYGKEDGLKGSDFYPASAYLDAQNRIWWGTGKAMAMLDLNKFEENKKAPRVLLTDLQLEQTFVDFRRLEDSIDQGKSYFIDKERELDLSKISFTDVEAFSNCPKKLELPYYLNHLTFYFSGIDWSAPHKVKYQYMLQGLDNGWRPITSNNWAVYSNTPSGEYIFKVRAIGDANEWSEISSYAVIIHPPWWNTKWAYILYFLLGLFSIYMVIRYRTQSLLKKKEVLERQVTIRTAEVVQQKEIVEKKNKEITSSITYAKRIQNAILPSKTLIDQNIPNSFFIYIPKDIVAGDFYWLDAINEDEILVAAADCTGHGVPGAMVSVVCNNALNRAVREFKLSSPADILNKTRELVIKTFEASVTEVNDGMDIALVKYNKKTKELAYCGANNDMYLVRANKTLEIIPSNKMPVGRYLKNKDFIEHSIQLEKGDTFYLFTDGYADQFGGPHYKKFKYSAFKDTIVEMNELPLEKQAEHLVNTLKDWMGTYDQIDDICVIGVKV